MIDKGIVKRWMHEATPLSKRDIIEHAETTLWRELLDHHICEWLADQVCIRGTINGK